MPQPTFSPSLSRRRLLVGAAALGALRAVPAVRASEDDPLPATARLNGWLETRYDFWLARSPMDQTYLGLKSDQDRWDDISDARRIDDFERTQRELADLRENFRKAALSPAGQLNHRLYDYRCEERIGDHPWRHHIYPLSQTGGWPQEIPNFLINIHRVESVEDAQAYIARLRGTEGLIDQIVAQMRAGEDAGVLAPRFSYLNALRDCRNVLSGAPFESRPDAANSPLWADIGAKIDSLKVEPGVQQKLRADALRVLVTSVRPAFLKLMSVCQEQAGRARSDGGVWKLPEGEAFYANRLVHHTTTTATAGEIHEFGLSEVARIQAEMRGVMRKVGFRGDFDAFLNFMRTDPQFTYPQTAAGKAAYIARTEQIIADMRGRLDEVFLRKPHAELVVKAVEPFREQSATAAFYQSPGAMDGRPGTYYVNTYDMKVMPKYEMEALAYHEAIPGHHTQIALAQEMDQLPRFRRFSSYTAYEEGWGLYCERLAKEIGLYQDPYADFGRLSSELWRACRLVVDTGIHMAEKHWTREEAVTYLTANTSNSTGDIANSVERYIVDPGQATAYKIGMERILSLRADATTRLGDKFDLRGFHGAILGDGSVPLPVLNEIVDAWVKDVLT